MAKLQGRRSLADRNSAEFQSTIQPTRTLTREEAKVWHRAVSSWPADHWIHSDADLLTQYCAVCVLLDKAFKDRELLVAERLGRLMLGYTRALRLTCQSRYDPKTSHRAAERGRENEAGENPLLGGRAWGAH
jgi:hypothetical protein